MCDYFKQVIVHFKGTFHDANVKKLHNSMKLVVWERGHSKKLMRGHQLNEGSCYGSYRVLENSDQ